VQYKWVDQVAGELYRPFEVRPAVMVNMTEKVYMFPTGRQGRARAAEGRRRQRQGRGIAATAQGLEVRAGAVPFSLAKAEEEKRVLFKVTPPGNASEAVIKAVVKTADGNTLGRGLLTIDHAHIPRQTLFPPPRCGPCGST
jgi:hypothetical protein